MGVSAPSRFFVSRLASLNVFDPLGDQVGRVRDDARAAMRDCGFSRVEYLDLRHPETLAPLTCAEGPARLLAAAWLGPVRLIDRLSRSPKRDCKSRSAASASMPAA